MKCYCNETDSAFTFYIEDVESAQLEDVILHKAWKKADGKFLMSFPQSAFSDQREKELISSNFSRLGQAMFESSLVGVEWKKPLEMVAQTFNENGIEWYIVGSVSDAIRGIAVTPSDVDIVVHTRDYNRAKDVCYLYFSESVIAPFMRNQDPKYFISPLKYFGRLFLSGAMIEIASDEVWDSESRHPEHKKPMWCGYAHSAYEKAEWHGYSIYLESLEHRFLIEIARKRCDRIKAFEEYMNARKGGFA